MKTLSTSILLGFLALPAFAQFSIKSDEMYSFTTPFVAESLWNDPYVGLSESAESFSSAPSDIKAIEAVANDFYRNFNEKKVAPALKNTTSDWHFFGTAPGERYDKETYRQGMEAAFRQSPHQQGITIKNRDIIPLSGGQSAYVIETGVWPIVKTPVRFVSVYVKTPEGWKMRMNNVQITMSDEYMPQFNAMVSKPATKLVNK